MQHAWPGNIRELRNCLQLAAGLCSNNLIEDSDIHLPESIQPSENIKAVSSQNERVPADDSLNTMEQLESNFITDLLKKYQGNRKLIANEMNISERTLYRKLKRLNLKSPVAV
jgi:DNA-binding NtrC family response regulator